MGTTGARRGPSRRPLIGPWGLLDTDGALSIVNDHHLWWPSRSEPVRPRRRIVRVRRGVPCGAQDRDHRWRSRRAGRGGRGQGGLPGRRGGRLHRVRGRRLQPVRDPLRARQGDRQTSSGCSSPPSRQYVDAGHRRPLRRPTVTRVDAEAQGRSTSRARARSPTTRWSWPPASTTPTRACPGGDLGGLYYVKNIREAMEWDKVLDTVKSAVVSRPRPLGVEMVTALAHRGIETHLVDPSPWPMSEVADPDIMAPVEESWRELGVITHFNTTLKALRRRRARCARCRPPTARSTADLVVVCTHKEPNTALGRRGRPQDRHRPAASSSTSGWRPRCPASSRPATAPRSRTG